MLDRSSLFSEHLELFNRQFMHENLKLEKNYSIVGGQSCTFGDAHVHKIGHVIMCTVVTPPLALIRT